MIKFQEKKKLIFVLVSLNFQNTLGRGNIFNIIKSFHALLRAMSPVIQIFFNIYETLIIFCIAFSFFIVFTPNS